MHSLSTSLFQVKQLGRYDSTILQERFGRQDFTARTRTENWGCESNNRSELRSDTPKEGMKIHVLLTVVCNPESSELQHYLNFLMNIQNKTLHNVWCIQKIITLPFYSPFFQGQFSDVNSFFPTSFIYGAISSIKGNSLCLHFNIKQYFFLRR